MSALRFRLTVRIPDSVWLDCLDPLATGMEADLGLDPDHPRDGYRRHVYSMTVEQVRDFIEYAAGRARLILSDVDDPDCRRVARRTIQLCDDLDCQINYPLDEAS